MARQWLPFENVGNGSDGAFTPSTGTDAPIDSACTGTAGTKTLSATNASFASDQMILIHQTRGSGSDADPNWELNAIDSYVAGTITTKYPLDLTYNTGAQVIVIKQYTKAVTGTGATVTVKAWTGSVGGVNVIGAFQQPITIDWNITGVGANGTDNTDVSEPGNQGGFRGGITHEGAIGGQGEGTGGDRDTQSVSANGSGGGGGRNSASSAGSGGGNGTAGTGGTLGSNGGSAVGSSSMSSFTLGGGGGGGGNSSGGDQGSGANGGACVFVIAPSITNITGTVNLKGGNGGSSGIFTAGGGGGAGGGFLALVQDGATIGTGKIDVSAGTGSSGGGNGGSGRASVHYGGTTTPSGSVTGATVNTTYDSSLASSAQGFII